MCILPTVIIFLACNWLIEHIDMVMFVKFKKQGSMDQWVANHCQGSDFIGEYNSCVAVEPKHHMARRRISYWPSCKHREQCCYELLHYDVWQDIHTYSSLSRLTRRTHLVNNYQWGNSRFPSTLHPLSEQHFARMRDTVLPPFSWSLLVLFHYQPWPTTSQASCDLFVPISGCGVQPPSRTSQYPLSRGIAPKEHFRPACLCECGHQSPAWSPTGPAAWTAGLGSRWTDWGSSHRHTKTGGGSACVLDEFGCWEARCRDPPSTARGKGFEQSSWEDRTLLFPSRWIDGNPDRWEWRRDRDCNICHIDCEKSKPSVEKILWMRERRESRVASIGND